MHYEHHHLRKSTVILRDGIFRICLLVSLAACAIHTPYPLGIKGREHVSIAVTSVTSSAHVSDLSDIDTAAGKTVEDKKARIRNELEAVRLNVDVFVHDWLDKRKDLHIEQQTHAVDENHINVSWLKMQKADLVLAVDISGYGRIKRKWVILMAGSGLIEAVVQGAVTASVTGNPAIGAGVALEEVASESLTWLGSAWLWNKFLAPVTLEGQMWRVNDGRLVWHKIEFADSSNLLDLLLGRKPPKKKKLLHASLEQAEHGLFDDLGRYINRQILFSKKR